MDLAVCYIDGSSSYGDFPITDAYEKTKHFLNKAIELDDQLGYAYAVLCDMKRHFEGDIAGAEAAIQKALELDPRSLSVREIYRFFLLYAGRLEEAIAEAQQMVRRDPLNAQYYFYLGRGYYYARRFDESLSAYLEGLEIDPHHFNLKQWISYTYLAMGQRDEALRSAQSFGHKWNELVVKAAIGQEAEAREYAAERHSDSINARIYGALNEKEKVLVTLNNMSKNPRRNNWIALDSLSHFYDCVRSDPRFTELVNKARTQGRIN